jgi:probable rRNA maturation factor
MATTGAILKVNILNRQKEIKLDIKRLKKIANYIADKFDSNKNAELNLVFAGANEISDLNFKYRNYEGPTDVLSFSYETDSLPSIGVKEPNREDMEKNCGFYITGEIVICPEIALKNSDKNKNITLYKNTLKWDVEKEITLLIIHGILHLYGYDHEKKQDFQLMENTQNSILNDVLINFFS